MNRLGPPLRGEITLILALTLLGAVLRFWSFGQIGLTHFDEGVYAMAGLWAQMPGGLSALDPTLIPYAPPGMPFLIGLSYSLFGVADSSAIFVSIACGILTIPAVGWVARRTFGPGAGAAAAALAALSLVHVAFSRRALTDAPFLLAWILAIGVGGWFLERPRLGRALVLGLAVGLAQYLKYNGWLTGIIVAGTAVLGAIRFPAEQGRGPLSRTFGWGLLAAVVALAAYWPWFQFVEAHGGYSALLRHHRSYLGGPGTWLRYLSQQLAQSVALSWRMESRGLIGIATVLAAWIATRSAPPSRGGWKWLLLGLIAGAAALSSLANLPWWIGLAWCPWLLFDARPAARSLAVWWLLLSIMSPWYHPYARLWLPLHAVGWLMLGGVVARGVRWLRALANSPVESLIPGNRRGVLRASVASLCLLAALVVEVKSGARPLPRSWFFEPTTEFRDEVSRLATTLPKPPGGRPVRVLARRPVVFYVLAYAGAPVILESGLEELRNASAGDRALIDEAVLSAGLGALSNGQASAEIAWRERSHWKLALEPVTLLDTNPWAAYPDHRERVVHFWDLVYSRDPQLPKVHGGR